MTDTNTAENLFQSIDNKTATVGVVGLGYVGLPLLDAYISSGFNTICLRQNGFQEWI